MASFTASARGLFISTGSKTAEFENSFAAYLGLPHAVGTTSCTHSLHLAHTALGIGPGDEVVVPAMTFLATAEAVIHAGARPVFADVDGRTGILDPVAAANAMTPRTKAVCPVHLYGVMAPMDRFAELARARGLKLVEDAAHCIEGRGPGFGPGTLSDAVAFSFYATKNITCGEGGAVATRHADVAASVKLLRNHGMDKNAIERKEAEVPIYEVERYGFKANMNDLQASLLIPQLARIGERLARREAIALRYDEGLKGTAGITTPFGPDGYRSARHLYTIRVADPAARDRFLATLGKKGVACSINYRPLSSLKYYREEFKMRESDFPNATAMGNTTITLPFYPLLRDDEADYVVAMVVSTAREFFGG